MAVLAVICLSRAKNTAHANDPGTRLLRSVFVPVMSNDALAFIPDDVQANDDLAVQALRAELVYFVAGFIPPQTLVEGLREVVISEEPRFEDIYDRFRNHRDELANYYKGSSGRALEEAKTIKDSLEDLLNLPDWLERMLKVLNELLKIV